MGEGNKGERGQRTAIFQNNSLKFFILNNTLIFFDLLCFTDFFALMFNLGGDFLNVKVHEFFISATSNEQNSIRVFILKSVKVFKIFFPLISQRCPLSTLHHCTGGLNQCNKTRKINKYKD